MEHPRLELLILTSRIQRLGSKVNTGKFASAKVGTLERTVQCYSIATGTLSFLRDKTRNDVRAMTIVATVIPINPSET